MTWPICPPERRAPSAPAEVGRFQEQEEHDTETHGTGRAGWGAADPERERVLDERQHHTAYEHVRRDEDAQDAHHERRDPRDHDGRRVRDEERIAHDDEGQRGRQAAHRQRATARRREAREAPSAASSG